MTQWTILFHLLSSGIILRMDLMPSVTSVNITNTFPLHMMKTKPGPTILLISRAKSEAAHNLTARMIVHGQTFHSTRQSHRLRQIFKRKQGSQRQLGEAAWPGDLLKALAKLFPKSQTSKALGQKHVLHAVVEAVPKCQVWKVFWKSHTFKAMVEGSSKS